MPSKIQGVSRGLTKDTVHSVPTCLKRAAAGFRKSPPCAYLTVTTQSSHVPCTSRTRESISGPCERPSLICLVHISLLSMRLLRHELLCSVMRPPACHAGHLNPPPPLSPYNQCGSSGVLVCPLPLRLRHSAKHKCHPPVLGIFAG